MKPDNKAGGPWLYALGLVPVIWFALLIAPAISGGLSEIVSALPAAMNHPFKICLLYTSTEELKATDMMRWIGLMNNIRACADEIVLNDIVYS